MSSEKRTMEYRVDLGLRWKTELICHCTDTLLDLEGAEEAFGELGVVASDDGALTAWP